MAQAERTALDCEGLIPGRFWGLWITKTPSRSPARTLDEFLAERGLLLQRKDPIVFYWEKVRAQHERRFDHELVNLAGVRAAGNWQSAAFGRLVEAVEVTAVQRGVERWRP